MNTKTNQTDRGVSTVVSHVLAIGITSLLVMGLLLAAGSYLEDQKEYAAREELETVGYRLANSLAQVDRLSQRGADVTTWNNLPERISGQTYDARVESGASCGEDRMLNTTTDTCLIVNSNGLGVSQSIPINATTDLAVTQVEPGRFKATSLSSPSTPNSVRRAGVVDLAMRVGIGRNVTEDNTGRNLQGTLNLPPTNVSFRIDPEWPSYTRNIKFEAEADDPDANNPETPCCLNYTWDINNDGVVDVKNSSTAFYNFSDAVDDPGVYTVTLNVTDKPGKSTIYESDISVSGLRYRPGSVSLGPSYYTGETVNFEMRNHHSDDILITDIFFKPISGADYVYAIEEYDCDPSGCDYRAIDDVVIDTDSDGNWEDSTDLEPYREVPVTGLLVSAGYGSGRDEIDAVVDADDTVRIQIRGVVGLDPNSEYVMGVSYTLDDRRFTTRFDTRELSP